MSEMTVDSGELLAGATKTKRRRPRDDAGATNATDAKASVRCGECGKDYRVASAKPFRCRGCGEVIRPRAAEGVRAERTAARPRRDDARPGRPAHRGRRPTRDAGAPPPASRQAKRDRPEPWRDLGAEAHVRALAIWHFIGLASLLPVLIVMLLITLASRRPDKFLIVLAAVLPVIGVGAALAFAGVGLWRRRDSARTLATVFNVVAIVLGVVLVVVTRAAMPVVTLIAQLIWAVATHWALYGERGARVFGHRYGDAIAADPDAFVPWWSSPLFSSPFVVGLVLTFAAIVVASVS